jgi:RNA polymerase sigma-70 factor (ECF subfamily)
MGSPDVTSDDAALLGRAVTDAAALDALYRRYVQRVTGFATRRCATADDVADAVAETFDRLLRSAHRYDPDRAPVASFVFAIAASTIADQHRRTARQRSLAKRLRGHDLLDDDDVARIEAAIDAADAVTTLAPALAALPADQSEVLRLVADGLSPTEAARELGISPNAARIRLSRARGRMRTHAVAEDVPEEFPKAAAVDVPDPT